jgi:hypothetical protein
MSTTTTRPTISAPQYHLLQAPAVLPTPKELFDFQVWMFKDKGLDLPPADVDQLYRLISDGEPQMFLVLPRWPDVLDLKGLMSLVEVNGVRGQNYLDAQYLTDVNPVPTRAHLLLNIEDGRGRRNTKPSVSLKNIKREERLPYPTWYGLVHCIVFPYVLQHHYLDLVGSRYKSESVPGLYLDVGGVPGLYSRWDVDANPEWGAPSAGRVAGI